MYLIALKASKDLRWYYMSHTINCLFDMQYRYLNYLTTSGTAAAVAIVEPAEATSQAAASVAVVGQYIWRKKQMIFHLNDS